MRSSKSRSRSKSNRQRTLGNITNRVFDSSGPEGKVRGTPQQIIEKYLTLARDAQLSHDRVAEQSFLQHAEHYTRMLGEANREMAERQGQQGQGRDDDHQGGHGYHQNGNGNGNGGHRDQRDGQNRDGQNRDGQNRDGQRDHQRDQGRDPQRDQSRENQGRDNAPRDGGFREARPAPQDEQPTLPDVISARDEDGAAPIHTPETDAPAVQPVESAPDAAPKPVRSRAPRSRAPRPAAPAEGGEVAAPARSRRKPVPAAPREGEAE